MKIRAIAIGQIIPFLYKNESILSFMQENLEIFSNLNEALISAFDNIDIEVQTKRIHSQPLFSFDNRLFYEKNLKETLVDIDSQLIFLQVWQFLRQLRRSASLSFLLGQASYISLSKKVIDAKN